jgi:hypothetical protein
VKYLEKFADAFAAGMGIAAGLGTAVLILALVAKSFH